MRNLPPLARLRTFEAAARLQSFALAALELHLTASAISHQIRDLEKYFGRALFERRHRQVQTTREGQRLFESLDGLFTALEASCAEVQLPTQDQVLAVHCAPSLALKWLGPRLPDFLALNPQVNIRLTTGAEPLDLAVRRDIDVAITYGAPRHSAGLDVCALGEEQMVPLVAAHLVVHTTTHLTTLPLAHPSAGSQHSAESPEQVLSRLPLIDSQLSPVSWPQWFAFHSLTLPARPRPSFDRAAMAIAAAVDGLGVALESTRLAARELARGDLVVLGADRWPALVRPVHFMSVRHTERARVATAAFVQWLLAQSAEPAPSAPTVTAL